MYTFPVAPVRPPVIHYYHPHPPVFFLPHPVQPTPVKMFVTPPRKLFHCRHCHKTMKSKKTLENHEKTQHTTIPKSFHCNHCNYKTTTKGSLKTHVDYQHGYTKKIVKWKCSQVDCTYQTKRKCHLTEHLRHKHQIGKKIKQFHCKLCSYKTFHHGSMKRHTNTHTKTDSKDREPEIKK